MGKLDEAARFVPASPSIAQMSMHRARPHPAEPFIFYGTVLRGILLLRHRLHCTLFRLQALFDVCNEVGRYHFWIFFAKAPL